MCTVRSASTSLIDGLTDTALETEPVKLAPGSVLFEPHTPALNLFAVEQGQVRIYQVSGKNDARLVRILGPGDWCGTAALANHPTYGKRAVSVGTTVLRKIPAGRLLQHLANCPGPTTVNLVRQLAAMFIDATEDAGRLAFDDCHSRLIKALIRFSTSAAATRHTDGRQVVLHITHQQLAQAVGAARETISLALTELRQKNLLRTGRNQLTFDPAVLRHWFENRATNGAPAAGTAQPAAPANITRHSTASSSAIAVA